MFGQGGTGSSDQQGQGNKRQRTAAMYHRKRAVTACQSCRLRKTKCDNVRPVCGFCSRSGAQCVYPGSGPDSDYSSYDPASLTILDRLNHVVSLLESRPLAVLVNETGSYDSPHEASDIPRRPASVSQPLRVVPIHASRDLTTLVPEDDVLQVLERPDFPSASNNCESIMRWPIFQGLVPEVHSFVLELNEDVEAGPSDARVSGGRGVQEEDFVPLSKRFLAYVHVKNPILDVKDYKNKVREAAENGPRWDACLSVPFHTEADVDGSPASTRSSATAVIDPDTAASYYLAAKKRLGLLQPSLLYIQCLFLCGIYEMYCLHPLQAWFHFNRACVDLRNILWTRSQIKSSQATTQETRRLEQRLYWSCVKTEYELRYEISLPPSGVTQCDYPDMFPSPPTELTSPSAYGRGDTFDDDIVPEEEKSWFYYLAEISYRRMMNRAMAVMARSREQGWSDNISEAMEHCKEFNEQIDLWYSHIPPQIDPKNAVHANNELAQFLKNRELSCREWIHRPFLFYVLHKSPEDEHYGRAIPLAQRCLELCVEHLFRTYGHNRHHGTWYIARSCVTKALILLAAAKSGRISLPSGWKEALETARWTQSEADRDQPYRYRALESPLHIRLIHLMPGELDEDIRLRISHELLRQPEQPRSLRLPRKYLQRTLPPGWQVFETIEGRFIFRSESDDASSEENGPIHTWRHPDPTIDPALYELPSLHPAQPAFEALSYVWGQQRDPVIATIEGKVGECLGNIKLGENLATALGYLRYQDKERVLWVDAICINQNDDAERATQVLRMPSIYQDCSRVIIWLGPEKHNIGLLFSELAPIGSQVETTTNGFIISSPDATDFRSWKRDVAVAFSDEVWSAMKRLDDRPWFHRLWTVQEAIMANGDSIVQSGDVIISWPLFRRAVACLLEKTKMPMPRVAIGAVKGVTENPIGATLAHTLHTYRTRQCSDPHDKIYALLAILPPRFASEIKPDYEQPFVELYKSCFLASIKALNRWELRGRPRNPDEDDCPSWVPDLSQNDLYGRGVRGNYASGCSALHYEYQAPNLLKVVGLRFDTVKSVSEKTFDYWDDDETAIRVIRSWEPECSLTDPYPNGGTYLDAFAATLLQDIRIERHPDQGFKLEGIKDWLEAEFLSTVSTQMPKLSRGDIMEYVIWTRSTSRAMVTTERGSIGLSCTFAKPGDVICVVLGCDFPVLLRPCDNNNWKFLSDCYVWDLEATQGLLGPLPSPWQAQLFYDPVAEHRSYTRYHNPEPGELTAEDPRLKPLVGWQRVSLEELGRDLTGDDPEVYDFFRNIEDGRIVDSDPRLEPEALKSRGVNLETFILS
ncbi:heterokaryon incompatibility protein [Fusarium mexicanum]|uniref:Heterokaryon incompatibility protein n=1 Tax=Fusarium mexicanum TaxID=751941 RepID=A0A8H5MWY5_9HYPO|nr:heterokaryon incompatibility protein [Fusarium mexicanum]